MRLNFTPEVPLQTRFVVMDAAERRSAFVYTIPPERKTLRY